MNLVIILSSVLLLILVIFIALIIYKYQQKQNAHFKSIQEIKINHENILLQSQIEIQEKTFQDIAIEIHDNIGQKLSLAKLLFNTLSYNEVENIREQVAAGTTILSDAVNELSKLSRSMTNELVLQNGVIKATEAEVAQIKKIPCYDINFKIDGDTIFLPGQRELILFRVIQESLHNIIKHAKATRIDIILRYGVTHLELVISDNGHGFDVCNTSSEGTGIKNIKKRVLLLDGACSIQSTPNIGTNISITIPFI